MTVLAKSICLWLDHRRLEQSVRVRADGRYIAQCKRCGSRLAKPASRARWRAVRTTGRPREVPLAVIAGSSPERMTNPQGGLVGIGCAMMMCGAAAVIGVWLAPTDLQLRHGASGPSTLQQWELERFGRAHATPAR